MIQLVVIPIVAIRLISFTNSWF